jgi:pyruvate,orthophosphate dikinase
MIFESDGLLTSRGGATSHAAVTAVRLGKTGVVNCRAMVFTNSSNKCVINKTEISSCDKIVIDGKLGFIYTFY